jgi:two-component system response regulator HydG
MTEAGPERARVLVVDDDRDMAETLADGLGERGYEVTACASSTDAAKRLEEDSFDALVTDLRMPVVDGMGLLAVSRRIAPERPVIVMTGYGAIETAVDAIREGAYHYMTKPFSVDELALFLGRALDDAHLRREARTLRAALGERGRLGDLVAVSSSMREVCDVALRVADAAIPVLLLGETGTGKTALAHAIHSVSSRARRPFVAVNCAALPEALLESELFGHTRGAFTGATQARSGLFVESDGGTLLLDEIGEMPPAMQVKLLHVIESGTVRAVGSDRERKIDVRILAATHRDLRQHAQAGSFREDLLYRLDVVTIEIPALRHRREDIAPLVERLLGEARGRHPRSPVERFAPDAMARLEDHAWPGNVRELAHVIERLVLLGGEPEVRASDLPASMSVGRPAGMPPTLDEGVMPIREVQRRYATWALDKLGGHRTRTAEALGIDVKTLAKWLAGE